MIHPVEEQRPVGQAGQLVVERAVAELPFEVALLGDVAERGDDPVHGVAAEQVGDRRLHPPLLAVDAHEADLELHGAPLPELQQALEFESRRIVIVTRHEIDQRTADPVVAPMPERADESRARVLDLSRGIDEHHDVARMLDHGREAALALTLGQLSNAGDEAPHPSERQHHHRDGAQRRDGPRHLAPDVGDRQSEQHRQGGQRGHAEPHDPTESDRLRLLVGQVRERHRRIEGRRRQQERSGHRQCGEHPARSEVSRSSCALRARSELSWHASPTTNRIVEGYRNRTCSAVRSAMASATASSSGIDAAQTWSTVATSLSPRNGSITINHTPTPTAMLTIVASMPLRSSLTVVPWPSIVAVATSRPAAMRRKGSATDENVSRDVKYNAEATRIARGQQPEGDGEGGPRQRPFRLVRRDAEQYRSDPDGGAMTRSHSAPVPSGTTR